LSGEATRYYLFGFGQLKNERMTATWRLYDWPIVTAADCSNRIREMGIKPWQAARPAIPIGDWLDAIGDMEPAEQEPLALEYRKFCPEVEMQPLVHPNKPTYTSRFFRTRYKPWVTVFALIPYDGKFYVPVTAEWKQGNRLITLVPPSGVPGEAEARIEDVCARMRATALREFQEETGFTLVDVVLLGPANGLWDQVRNAELHFFPFLGVLREPLERKPPKPDESEVLKVVLFELDEWLKVINAGEIPEGFGIESCAVTTTFLALTCTGLLPQQVTNTDSWRMGMRQSLPRTLTPPPICPPGWGE
jgi:8-oxo-dGTP pyrophosphatase MutT (NUDIX family)